MRHQPSPHPPSIAGLTLAAILGIGGVAFSTTPTVLGVRDPLSQAPPNLAIELPEDPRPGAEKIVPQLAARLRAAKRHDPLDVVVALHWPRVKGRPADRSSDAERALAVAVVAHRFVDAARPLGLSAARGLSMFPVVSGRVPAGGVQRIAALPLVRSIEEDVRNHLMRVEGGALMRATELRDELAGDGRGIDVAVLDSGIDPTHAELAGRVEITANTSIETDDGTFDGPGHGTAVAGIIAGSGGMAPAADLWNFKIVDNTGSGPLTWELAALDTLFSNRNEFGGLDLVSMAFGGSSTADGFCDDQSPAEAELIDVLVSAGIAVVAASGNAADKAGISRPACLAGTIALGSVYDGAVGPVSLPSCFDPVSTADQIACYSNSGSALDALAPAECATTPTRGGNSIACFGGTSAATAYAAGVAAQLLSLRAGTPPEALRQAFRTTGEPLTDSNGLTHNRIDALAALQALPAACEPSSTTLCLNGGRFQVEVTWSNFDGATGDGRAVTFSTPDSGIFWFFDPNNWELMVKIVDGCGFNDRFWVFAAATTNVEYTLRVTDTANGTLRTYENPLGTASAAITDTEAFDTCP